MVNGSTSNGIERRAIGNGRKGPGSFFTGGLDFRTFENDLLDARNYSITGQDTPRSPYNHFTVGGQLQGPLYIPHLFHWQGNFFIQFQTTRQRNASTQDVTMPTLRRREGDFSGWPPSWIHPPSSRFPTTHPHEPDQFPGQILSEILSAAAIRAPTALANNYQVPMVSRMVQDQLSGRVNKTINNKSSLNPLRLSRYHNQNNNIVSFVDHTKPVTTAAR